MSKGIPFDVAMSLPDYERLAWCVIYGELEGGEFDWDSMSWVDRK